MPAPTTSVMYNSWKWIVYCSSYNVKLYSTWSWPANWCLQIPLKHDIRPCCCNQLQVKLKVTFYKSKISICSNHSHLVVVQLVKYFVRQFWQNPLSKCILKWHLTSTMELIKCEGETDFHSVTDMNCEQEGEVLDLNEQVDPNFNTNTLVVSKVTQWFNEAPIQTFIYTNDTVRAICVKVLLPEPIHTNFLNEYDCVLEFPTQFELHKIAMDLQQTTQWFGYDVVITCEVVTKDVNVDFSFCLMIIV